MTQAVGAAGGAAGGAEGAAGGAAGGATGGAAAWIDTSIQDQSLRDFATNKGYNKLADPSAAFPVVVQQYQALEKLVGAEKAGRTVELPNWEADDDSAKASRLVFNEKLGVPKVPGDYKLQLKIGDKIDENLSNAFAGMLHKAGVPARSVAGLAKDFTDFKTAEIAATKAADDAKYAAEDKGLRTEWGAKYDDNMKLASSAAKTFGIKGEALNTLQKAAGYSDVMKMFIDIAGKLGEANFVDGQQGGSDSKMTPAEAKVAIKSFLADAEVRKGLNDKYHPKHAEYMARKAQLTAWEVGQ